MAITKLAHDNFCREGIVFAMSRHETTGEVDHSKPPPHVDFLLILAEFSHRLLVVDRCGERGVLPFLMKQLPEGQFKRILAGKMAGWDPLVAYFKITQPNKGTVATAVGAKGRKRKGVFHGNGGWVRGLG